MQNDQIKSWVYMGVFAALTLVATILIRIPVPATQGYVHPGDSLLILSAWLLGRTRGSFAGAAGQSLADLMGGYALYAPVTLLAKFLMGICLFTAFSSFREYRQTRRPEKLLRAGVFTVTGFAAMAGTYYLVESAVYGSFLVPLAEIPANLVQFAFGFAVAAAAAGALSRALPQNRFTNL